ncbi:unnamed protein product [Auanema sp. JU1783]|nr:unnamed protein product [Auanema sp. JU1783]
MGAMMGKITECDDAKTGLQIDWDLSDFSVFTCDQEKPFPIANDITAVSFELTKHDPNFNPRTDQVTHKCIVDQLVYNESIPIRGDHRPNWARFGEYLYLPVQRWLHNLEHGSIILLYHPCVDRNQLQLLRSLVTGCLWRHVVTPYNKLSSERPLALVAWGAKLEMNHVIPTEVITFIREHAHVAPEDISRDGLYDQYLIKAADVIDNDPEDKNVCGKLVSKP